MDCVNCSHRLPKTGFYCTNCGTKIEKENYIEPKEVEPSVMPTFSDSLLFRDALIAKRIKSHNQATLRAWLRLTILAIFSLVAVLLGMRFGVTFGVDRPIRFVGYIFAIWIVVSFVALRSKYTLRKHINGGEYYMIPGSRNEKGYHRCIYCGGYGVAKQSFGGRISARCHRCQRELYSND